MTVNTLLVPTDGSDSAIEAARRGFDLAEAFGAAVHVLSVADSTIATGAGYAGDSASIRARLRDRATARAASLRDEAIERGIDATAVTREGIPANEIVTCADESGIDAIVLGTAGRGGVARTVVGSVADKVVRTAPVPVVTIRPEAVANSIGEDVDSILLPTDGSTTAREAAELGFELAVQLDATVHLLTVIDSDRSTALSETLDADRSDEKSQAGVAEHLEPLASEARERGLEVDVTVRAGRPAEAIVAYAESNPVDLIALGTAGRGGFERFVLGSVADRVIRSAPVPVLTTRPGESAELGE